MLAEGSFLEDQLTATQGIGRECSEKELANLYQEDLPLFLHSLQGFLRAGMEDSFYERSLVLGLIEVIKKVVQSEERFLFPKELIPELEDLMMTYEEALESIESKTTSYHFIQQGMVDLSVVLGQLSVQSSN